MAEFSRRRFLQLVGISLLAPQLPAFEAFALEEADTRELKAQHGRALLAAPVHAWPAHESPIIGQLWPDSVIPIADGPAGWYRVGAGYAPRAALQPIVPVNPVRGSAPRPAPFWAEVTGPAAAVRQWCAADAPLVTRIGHGGTARVIGVLGPGEQGGPHWYALAAGNNALLGWSQAALWQPIEVPDDAAPLRLEIERRRHQLVVLVDDRPALRATITVDAALQPGEYAFRRGLIAGPPLALEHCDTVLFGVPWQLELDNQHSLTGAYWHNRFGHCAPGPAVQVPPFLARWLYAQAGEGSTVKIR
ncbi:MAG: hypothetical protein ACUVSX_04825 [Aggregatilineales bacterium]